MNFNIADIPFSRRGSFFVVSNYKDNKTFIRDVRGGDFSAGKIFEVELVNNDLTEPHQLDANETKLSLSSKNNSAELIMPHQDYLRVRGDNGIRLTLCLKRYDHLNEYSMHQWELHSYSQNIKMMLTLLEGEAVIDAPWDKIGNEHVIITINGPYDFTLESYQTIHNFDVFSSFEDDSIQVQKEYSDWQKNTLNSIDKKYQKSHDLASYITWSSLVKPEGLLKQEAMYMSKNWMTNIWSWDHCFNAMALAKYNPELAFNQFIYFYDHQDISGAMPDFMNNQMMSFSCVKPPVHGWCYQFMMKHNSYFKQQEQMLKAYDMLAKWTNYWLKYRRKNEEELPYYNHGNDSGWDNASVFDDGCPVISPDLSSYLVLQCETLAELSKLLGKNESSKWESLADKIQTMLINQLWDGSKFIVRNVKTGHEVKGSNCLINLMPIVIGNRLPKAIVDRLVKKLSSSEFYTDFGFATESTSSKFYQQNGYWRGPIWAPTTLLIIDGLIRSGYQTFAEEASIKFSELTLKGDMAENFDPQSGEGLVDPAFTWTSSVFLLLSSEYWR